MTRTRKTALTLSLLLLSGATLAAKSCEELKAQIDDNISGKGLQGYLLQILPNAEAEAALAAAPAGKEVGRCAGGSAKILYWRAGEKPAEDFPHSHALARERLPEQSADNKESPQSSEKAL